MSTLLPRTKSCGRYSKTLADKLLLYTELAQKEAVFALPACSRVKTMKYSMAGTEQENQDCLAKSCKELMDLTSIGHI